MDIFREKVMFSDVETLSEAPSSKKTNKPLMEKKRRARINRCLSELKDILIKDNHVSASHAKWEKADILEMTVDYVKKLRNAQGFTDLKRRAPSVEEAEEPRIVLSKSPASVCSPPSTSSTEFSEAPETKRKRRSDQEPGQQPHAPIPTYPGISQQYLAQQFLLAQLHHQTNLKMAAVAPMLPISSFPSAMTSTVLGAAPWR